MPENTYQPLTPQQFASAKKAGFSATQIVTNEQKRKASMTTPVAPAAPQTFGQKVGSIAGGAVNLINNNPVSKALTSLAALPVQLGAKALGQPDPFANGVGTGIGPVQPAAVSTYQGKTNGQFGNEEAGNALQAASLFFPYGKVAGAAEEAAAPFLGKTLGGIASKVASSAAGGYGVDVASNLQNGQQGPAALKPGLGTAIGTSLPLVGPLAGAAGRAAGESLGVTTGAGYGAIKEAFNAASAGGDRLKAYTDALRGKTPPEAIVNDADDALKGIIADRTKSYQTQLANVTKDNTKSFDISPVQNKLDSMLSDFNVEKDSKTGALDFSRSPGLGRYKGDLQDIQDVLKNWGSKPGDRTVVGIDKLKQTLDDFRRGTADSRKFDSFVTGLRNSAQDIIRKEPGYSKLVGDYADKTGLIKDIQKGLSLGDKASIDTGFRKLTTALRTNNEFRKELIGELDQASGGFLSSKIAGQQLSEVLPRGIARQIEGFGALGSVATGVGILPILKVAAFASPRVVGEVVRALGISKGVFTQLLDHLGAEGAQFPGDRAVDQGTPAVKNYLAKNPPSLGMAIKDVNKMSPEERAGLNLPETPGSTPAVPGSTPKALGANPAPEKFEGFNDVTTNLLDDLKGRSTVSKQYINDALNRADIKQAEKNIIKPLLDQEGPTINVKDFANKVKTELLPLKVLDREFNGQGSRNIGRYDFVSLPDDVKGPVSNYGERLYTSPIKTRAGDTHFAGQTGFNSAEPNKESQPLDNYFAHTRIEDLESDHPDVYYSGKPNAKDYYTDPNTGATIERSTGKDISSGDTRRVIELQSDLFQKGRLEDEEGRILNPASREESRALHQRLDIAADPKPTAAEKAKIIQRLNELDAERHTELSQLQPYKNTWQERVVREEVKQAAIDGKTKLQFPTGDTAMKIEGLVNREDKWVTLDNEELSATNNPEKGQLITYQDHEGEPNSDRRFLVTKSNGDGTFDAVDSLTAENDSVFYNLLDKKGLLDDGRVPTLEELQPHIENDPELTIYLDGLSEHLSARETIDKENPIHKYYEKELGKFLQKKYNAERITDPQGQTWYQVNVPEAAAKEPVKAFGKAKIGALVGGAAASAAGLGALAAQPQPLTK